MPERRHEVTRLEGLSDAVFAGALTLLAVSLQVPNTMAELRVSSRAAAQAAHAER